MGENFGARLASAVAARGALCVGLDPHAELLVRWGFGDTVEGVARFSRTVVEALADRVAVIKPQSAFYERFGSAGIAVLESTIRQLREAGSLVLLDVKRGDIGSTAAAYAQAYLDPSSTLYVDAITASPFLGFGSLRPMIDSALASGSGVFVLALTSNPEGASVQRAVGPGGSTVAQTILDEVAQVNAGAKPSGSIGVVVGATVGETGHDFRFINGPVLVPGMGAQGGSATDLRTVFGDDLSMLLPTYAREILRAGPDKSALREAAVRAREACDKVLMSDR
jgi:orotidine-5'-phosphate decarboxylase